ncbi:unnamed protein product [Mytilus edulis]|uniref:DZIP3-like HEPN domain-containing protein n=1 Tax=Mytilus edulis TaxID=6550 RepID=A0A8S3QWI1_MYTED|nr:unnamed protein product [Mytilus edulis]
MSLLLFGISQRAARVLFDSEFAPQTLQTSISKAYRKLVKLKKTRSSINPNGTFFSTKRHLISLKPPDNGFDKLPSETNSTPSAALATIKYYRNYIAHLQEAIIKTSYFNKAWNNITGAVERLGGKHMLEECKELRTKVLEQSTVPWNRRVDLNYILTLEYRTYKSDQIVTRVNKGRESNKFRKKSVRQKERTIVFFNPSEINNKFDE